MERRIEDLFQNDRHQLPNFDKMWEQINPEATRKKKVVLRGSIHITLTTLLVTIIMYGWNTNLGIEFRQIIASYIYDYNELQTGNMTSYIDEENDEQPIPNDIVKDLPTKTNYFLLLSDYLPNQAKPSSYVPINANTYKLPDTTLESRFFRGNSYSIFTVKYSNDSSEQLVRNLIEANVDQMSISKVDVYYLTDSKYQYLIWNKKVDGKLKTFALGSPIVDGLKKKELILVVKSFLD